VSFTDDLLKEPWRFDFFATLRRAERHFDRLPRIGHSATLDEDFIRLGQDPYLEFPASTFNRATRDQKKRLKLLSRFLGMLGPQGALPTAVAEESWIWMRDGDESFARFLDVFEHRFLQLFFRAWADSRPIAHADRWRPAIPRTLEPKQRDLLLERNKHRHDRFEDYVGTAVGLGSPPYRDLDRMPDAAKIGYAGLLAPKARSAQRLKQMLGGLFGVEIEVDEFAGSRLIFHEEDRSILGRSLCRLNEDFIVGTSVFSVEDKITIRVHASTLRQYHEFLPSGRLFPAFTDAIYFYLGPEIDFEAELAIPARETRGVKLGSFGQLGWTSWLAPEGGPGDARIRSDARFHPMSRRKTESKPVSPKQGRKGAGQ
jgi:type VI secretion system protein ImpH